MAKDNSEKVKVKEVKMRAYRIVTANDTVTKKDATLLDILPSDMKATNLEERLMVLSEIDKFSEKDTLAYLKEVGKGVYFGMMVRLRPTIQDGVLEEKKLKNESIELSDFITKELDGIKGLSYKEHYYFALSNKYIIVSFSSSPRKLFTYLNWLIRNSSDLLFDYRSVMKKKLSKDTKISKLEYKPKYATKGQATTSSATNTVYRRRLDQMTFEMVKGLFSNTEGLDEALAEGGIDATLVISFNRATLKKENRDNLLQLEVDHLDNPEDFFVDTSDGRFSLAEMPYTDVQKIEVTEQGFLSEPALIQRMKIIMSDLHENYDEPVD